MAYRFDTERQDHAAQVIAAAFDGEVRMTTPAGATLNALLHALLTHEKYRGLRFPGEVGEGKNTEAYEAIRDYAIMLARGCKSSWDGVEFAWEHYGEALLRKVEATYTYVVPVPA